MTFLDTSAPGRLLVTDVGSAEILGLFRSGVGLFGSSLMTAELLRVATRNQLSYTKCRTDSPSDAVALDG